MSIPLPPGLGENRKIAPFNGAGVNLSLFDCLRENAAFVPMQFLFVTNLIWKVDLSSTAPRRPLQKISCLYIDALNSLDDAYIFFPNTGWGIRIGAGTQFLVNDLAGRSDYVFYVGLKTTNSPNTDIINIFALNINVPFFDTLWQYTSLNGNKSTWFFTPSAVQSFDMLSFNEDGILGSFFGFPMIPAKDTQKIYLKHLIYSFNLSSNSEPSPAPLCSLQLEIVDSIAGVINSNVFTNTQNGQVFNNDFFQVNILNLNYTSAAGASITYNGTILTGSLSGESEIAGAANNIAYTLVYDYI